MVKHRWYRTAFGTVAAAVVVAGLTVGCGNDDGNDASTATVAVSTTTAAPATATATMSPMATGTTTTAPMGPNAPAAELRSGLTALLQAHVYLAGTATGAALRGDNAGFTAAAKTLDTNSVALSKAIGSVYGNDAEQAFLALWRKHIGFFVDYTQGKAANDMAKVEKARADLDGYRADFGAFISSANPNLPKDAVAQELKPHVESLFAAIDAQAAGDPAAYDKLATAASGMPGTAQTLAAGIAKQFPDKFGR